MRKTRLKSRRKKSPATVARLDVRQGESLGDEATGATAGRISAAELHAVPPDIGGPEQAVVDAAAAAVDPAAPAGDSGGVVPPLDAARASASGADELPPEATTPPPVDGEVLVRLVEVALAFTVRGLVAVHKARLDSATIAALSRFDASERGVLVALAPYAAPYFPRLLDMLPKLAAAGFAGFVVIAFAQRSGEIKRLAREQRQPKPEDSTDAHN